MQPIDIQMPEKVYKKVMWFIDKSPVEISLLGNVVNKDGALIVTDVFLPDQVNSACETEMKPESVAELMYKTKDMKGTLNCWIHSHVNMTAHWSGTDLKTIEEFGGAGYCLAIVLNKREEFRCAYYQSGDGFRASVFMDELDFTVTSNIPSKHLKNWEQLYKERCHKPVYTAPTYDYYSQYEAGFPVPPTDKVGFKPSKIADAKTPTEKAEDPNMKFDGMIHPTKNDLRYSIERGLYISYEAYIKQDDKYDKNLLDDLEQRSVAIDGYTISEGRRPEDDYEVNDFYMETTKVSFFDFYTEVEPELPLIPTKPRIVQ